MSHEEKDFFRTSHSNVPIKGKSQLEDLGMANNFEHKIDLD
jgi:hypothetical protein